MDSAIRRTGREAIPDANKAMLCARCPGEEHPATATALNNLGFLVQAIGEYPAAFPYMEQALAIRKDLGEDDPDTALSFNNLGILLHAIGDFATASLTWKRVWQFARSAARTIQIPPSGQRPGSRYSGGGRAQCQ